MDKIILIHYLSNKTDMNKATRYSEGIKELSIREPDMINILIMRNGDNEIVCINPKLVSKEEYTKAESLLVEANKIALETIENYKKKADKLTSPTTDLNAHL